MLPDPPDARSRAARRGIRTPLVLCLASILAVAGRHRFLSGDPGSAGSIPYAANPLQPSSFTIPFKVTVGQVVDSLRQPISGVPVVVMLSGGIVVAELTTNSDGIFLVDLPDVVGLSVSLPMNGIFDVPIVAGDPVLIVLP